MPDTHYVIKTLGEVDALRKVLAAAPEFALGISFLTITGPQEGREAEYWNKGHRAIPRSSYPEKTHD